MRVAIREAMPAAHADVRTYERTYGRTSKEISHLTKRFARESRKPMSPIPTKIGNPEDILAPAIRADRVRFGEREPLSPMLRRLVYQRDGWQCQLCGGHPFAANPQRKSGALHLDHIIPWSAGGPDRSDNLRTLCGPCNIKRSNFVARTDQPALAIVKICTGCLIAIEPRYEPSFAQQPDRFEVWCAKSRHTGWAVPGWRIV